MRDHIAKGHVVPSQVRHLDHSSLASENRVAEIRGLV